MSFSEMIKNIKDIAQYGSIEDANNYREEQKRLFDEEEKVRRQDYDEAKKEMDKVQKQTDDERKRKFDELKAKIDIVGRIKGLFDKFSPQTEEPKEVTPASSPTPTPTPRSVSQVLSLEDIMDLVNKYFSTETPERKDQLANTFMKESSGRIGAYHINKPNRPTGLSGNSGYLTGSETEDWWKGQRRTWPSIDVGLTQLSTADAMNDYLANKGYTYWQLLHDPEKNMEVASDLYYGKIPYTSPGLGNWVAASLLGYQ